MELGTQLQNYATQTPKQCPHPINKVDDNRFCLACGTQLPPAKVDTIAAQAQTIKRLADALEVALSLDERTNLDENVWSMNARALLAEIRGKHA